MVQYLCLFWSLHFDANQVQVLVVESLVGVAVLALLPAASFALRLFVLFILVDHEACAFLYSVSY
jgi:hypothetical protein